jgi:formylglycine-generating enzyme required for sulfatase activity
MGTKTKLGTVLAAIAVMFSTAIGQSNFTETVNGVGIDMIYVAGGTYQRGCTSGDAACNGDEKPVHNVTLSSYYAGKTEVTQDQFWAVMGWWRNYSGEQTSRPENSQWFGNQRNIPVTNITWYDAVEFTCELSKKTNKKYRLLTDAEFEYAARGGSSTNRWSGNDNAALVARYKDNTSGSGCSSYGACEVGSLAANALGFSDMSGNVYEWVWDNWSTKYSESAKTNPTPVHKHTQKTRRGGSYDQPASESRVSARKIRSIDGKDGSIGFRLALSSSTNSLPEGMKDPCDIHQPVVTAGKKGFRDERMITADNEAWVYDMSEYVAGFSYILRLWADGTAKYSSVSSYGTQDQVSGEWYTLSNFSLYIVPTSGSEKRYLYIPLTNDDGTNNMSMMPYGDMPGRYERMTVTEWPSISNVTRPNIANPRSGQQLAPANYSTDMSNPPETGRDQRLMHGANYTWLQDNVSMGAGGTHRYRWDFESNDFTAFYVYDGNATSLARGPWFTVDDGFMRVKDPNGHNYDYLYTVKSDGSTYYHISYQEYEPADFRMFEKTSTSSVPGWTPPDDNITTFNQGASTYKPPSNENPGLPPTYVSSQTAMSNFATQARNGVNLLAMSGAAVEIYGISGNLVSKQNYSGGERFVSLAHLPKGMYVVKVRFGSNVKVLRVPVM